MNTCPARVAQTEGAAPRTVGPHYAQRRVEDEHAQGNGLQHHLDEAFLSIQLARALGHHALLLRVEARVLKRDGGLVGEGEEQLLLRGGEAPHLAPEDADGADGAIAHPERCRHHRAEAAAAARGADSAPGDR